jgi:hypothetical protein
MKTNETDRTWKLPWENIGVKRYEHKTIGTHFGYDNKPSIALEPDSWTKDSNIVGITVDKNNNPIYYSESIYPEAKFNNYKIISCPKCHSDMLSVEFSNHVVSCSKCNIIMHITFNDVL